MNFNEIRPFFEKHFDEDKVEAILSTISFSDWVEAENFGYKKSLKIREEYIEMFLLDVALKKMKKKFKENKERQ